MFGGKPPNKMGENNIYANWLKIAIYGVLISKNVYSFKNPSKRVLRTRIGAHFMDLGQDLTMMVI